MNNNIKNSYRKIIVLIGLFLLIIFFIVLFLAKDKSVYMIDVVNKNIDDVYLLLSDYDILINVKYEYSDTVEKDNVISQNILVDTDVKDEDILNLVVSLGKIDKVKLSNDNINELGKVPIMMYHGIKNIKDSETKYTGGNFDKDGYTRTSESFRRDLELYYKKGYRMIKLSDYINGNISTSYGYSPIILTFDDGNIDNIRILGLDSNGDIIIDKNSAVGILEEFKKKYPDYNVTASFFVTNNLFNQPEYDEKILKWLVDNGYEVGNHTMGHNNFTEIDGNKTQEVVGYMYNKLENIVGDNYLKVVALPYGSPYNKNNDNYKYILNGNYNDKEYITDATLRVGWEPEFSPYHKVFDKTFLKRCRAYDNNGLDFDIEMTFRILDRERYISDGNVNTIVISSNDRNIINNNINKEIIMY